MKKEEKTNVVQMLLCTSVQSWHSQGLVLLYDFRCTVSPRQPQTWTHLAQSCSPAGSSILLLPLQALEGAMPGEL